MQQLLANKGNQGVQHPQDPSQNEDMVVLKDPVVAIPPPPLAVSVEA